MPTSPEPTTRSARTAVSPHSVVAPSKCWCHRRGLAPGNSGGRGRRWRSRGGRGGTADLPARSPGVLGRSLGRISVQKGAPRRRLFLAAFLVFGVGGVVLARLAFLQIVLHGHYAAR